MEDAVSADARFKSVEREAVEVMNVVTGSKVKCPEGKEVVDVCLAIQEIREEGRLEGRLEGQLEGEIRAYKKLGILPEDARRYLMEERHKSEDEAELLIRRYWN